MATTLPRKIPKEYRLIVNPFIENGTVTVDAGTKHMRVVRADGHKCPIPWTPGDHRSLANFKSQFRRFVAGESILR